MILGYRQSGLLSSRFLRKSRKQKCHFIGTVRDRTRDLSLEAASDGTEDDDVCFWSCCLLFFTDGKESVAANNVYDFCHSCYWEVNQQSHHTVYVNFDYVHDQYCDYMTEEETF